MNRRFKSGEKKTTSSSGRDDDNSQPKQKDNHFTIELEKGKKNKNLMNLIDFFFVVVVVFGKIFPKTKKFPKVFSLKVFHGFFHDDS